VASIRGSAAVHRITGAELYVSARTDDSPGLRADSYADGMAARSLGAVRRRGAGVAFDLDGIDFDPDSTYIVGATLRFDDGQTCEDYRQVTHVLLEEQGGTGGARMSPLALSITANIALLALLLAQWFNTRVRKPKAEGTEP
jgi:hypothetical protein